MNLATIERIERRVLWTVTPATTLGIGFLGDSYTDEYQFYPIRDTAKNFVELLGQDRGLNLGGFTTSNRGDARNQGYGFNWALSGATSTDMINEELPGLLKQVHSHQVRIVWMFIGGNDYASLLTSADPESALSSVQTTVWDNIKEAATKILAASGGAHVVIANLPDFDLLPQGRTLLADGVPSLALNVVDGTEHAINNDIASFAKSNPRALVADFSSMANSLLKGNSFKVDGRTISLSQDGDVPTDAFLADGVHPGTVVQAEIANLFINTVDKGLGLTISPFSPKQILDAAGI